MPSKKNWIGYKYNTFEVIAEDVEHNNNQLKRIKSNEIKKFNNKFLCKCQCGNVISVCANQIAKNRPLSCGCKEIRYSEDLIGRQFGDWTVISENLERRQYDRDNNKNYKTYWNCRCICGKVKAVSASHLKSGRSKGCGCRKAKEQSKNKRIDLTGRVFGKLRVLSDDGYINCGNKKRYRWTCQCECGKIASYDVDDLTGGKRIECDICRAGDFNSVRSKAMYKRNQTKIDREGSLYDDLSYEYSDTEIYAMWSNDNKLLPNEITRKSHASIILVCPKCSDKYKTSALQLYGRAHNIMCPSCTQNEEDSSYEKIVKKYLNDSLGLETLHEYGCSLVPINPKTGNKLRYDNEVVKYHLIIEVHGAQHYSAEIPDYWANGKDKNELFDDRKYKDEYKMNYAIQHGNNYLAISYIDINNGNYRNIINSKINEIKQRG